MARSGGRFVPDRLDVYKRQSECSSRQPPPSASLTLGCPAADWSRNATSVSYTHLDVYKRQVYVLHEDNTESMVFDPQEIMEHGGLCGVDREEWEKSPQFHEKVMERQEHQQEREQAVRSQNRDCFAIYQVSRDAVSYTHLSPF